MLKIVSAAVVVLVSGSAMADGGFYVLGGLGQSQTSARQEQVNTSIRNIGVTALESEDDSRRWAGKVQVGYQLLDNLAIEGGYANLSHYRYAGGGVVDGDALTREGKIATRAWTLDLVGGLPVAESVRLLGRLGMARYSLKFDCQGTGYDCENPHRKAKGSSLHYGLGLEWRFAPSWFARAEHEVFRKVGDALNEEGTTGTTRADISLTSLSLGYRF
jgi:OmpA-OmpF porin, OOP family